MERADALRRLSRQHHQGLYVALLLKRDAVDARERFLAFWEREGRRHFRAEEDVLLPAYSRHAAADDPAVVRVLTEHIELRRRAMDLAADPFLKREELNELGHRLEEHIRHEERVLFPAIEAALSGEELTSLAEELERAEASG